MLERAKGMIKKHIYFIANALIIILILIGFSGIQINEFSYYKELAEEHAKNSVSITASDINSQITNLSMQQRVVSQMMANDIFFKQWCEEESADEITAEHAEILYDYLNTYKEKYDYDIVFFVSNNTYNYYYDGGLNKVISPEDDFDIWYFNFLGLNQEYDIQIDHDEVNDYSVSLFVNCLVTGDDGEILGVVGAGKIIDDFQSSMDDLVETFDVDICIVNIGNAHNSFSGSSGYYKTVDDAAEELGLSIEEISEPTTDAGKTWSEGDYCYSFRTNQDLNWNIIVSKNVSDFTEDLLSQTYGRIVFLLVIITIYILVSFTFLGRMSKLSRKRENTDETTGLINGKIFRDEYEKYRKKASHKKVSSMFVLDVDDFKVFNDTYGHLYGNTVLRMVADELSAAIGSRGVVARWGGDEFVGVIEAAPKETSGILDSARATLKDKEMKLLVSFSCGIVEIYGKNNIKDSFSKADEALYMSKQRGKSCSTIFEK